MKPDHPRRDDSGTVYVLHIEPPYRHAGHYIGWTADADASRRFVDHLYGRGSPLIKAAVEAGRIVTIELEIQAGRFVERKMHNRHGSRVCPRCLLARALQPLLPLFVETSVTK